MKIKLTSRDLAATAMMMALSLIMIFTPLGTIVLPGAVQITIAHIPTMICALVLGPIPALICGAFLGLMAVIRCLLMPTSPFDVFFANPLVAIPPRALVGLVCFWIYKITSRLHKPVRLALAAVAGSLTNTVGVLGILYLIYVKDLAEMLSFGDSGYHQLVLNFIIGVAGLNGLIELAASALIATPVVMGLNRALKKGS